VKNVNTVVRKMDQKCGRFLVLREVRVWLRALASAKLRCCNDT